MLKLLVPLLAGALVVSGPPLAVSAVAQSTSRDDQGQARKEQREGKQLTSREIERIVLPQMKGMDYLTFEFDSVAKVYRLKFIKDGHVVFVDVDARTGRILSRSQ
ncbi:MAG TPA: PepSY domain-containing protein [Sphingomonadaceae bacterium]